MEIKRQVPLVPCLIIGALSSLGLGVIGIFMGVGIGSVITSTTQGAQGGAGSIASQQQLDMAVPDPCLLYTSPSPRDVEESRMPSSA